MRRHTPIAHLLYQYLFPHPTTNDPPTFSAHLARNLVPEVRIEVATFYGDLNSAEARYPGLNYCHASHRMRLGRFKHHKRLFDAFDNLGLTESEIQDFCCWEGTKWARERYERDEGIKVEDTTGDDIEEWVDRRGEESIDNSRRHSITRKTDISIIVEEAETVVPMPTAAEDAEMSDADEENGDAAPAEDDTETELEPPAETVARQQHVAGLYRRREDSVHRRVLAESQQTTDSSRMSPEMEQLIKEQTELGNVRSPADISRLMASSGASSSRLAVSGYS